MEHENKGGFFKAAMAAAFLFGAWVYFSMWKYFDYTAAKLGFAAIGVFSALTAVGMLMTDLSVTRFFRATTKLSAFLFPAAVNSGAFAARFFLLKGYDAYAVISAAAGCIISAVCAAVLVKRYREDDL